MINHNNLVHFKSDGVVWEMKFSKTTSHLFGNDTTDTAYVRGGCYTKSFLSRLGEPCFHHLCYDDPADAIYEDKYNIYALKNTATQNMLVLIYKNNYIKGVLEEVAPLVKNNS
jgi:hypothetical protein